MATQLSAVELALDLGVPTQEVLDALGTVWDKAPQAPDSLLSSEAVELVRQRLGGAKQIADDEASKPLGGGAALLIQAFEIAKAAGKPDWRSMSAAVLKNRILDLTERQFDERTWGVDSFTDWLALFADVVRVDYGKHPSVVELLGGDETPIATEHTDTGAASLPARPWKVRRDLWLALTDPRTEGRWAWVDGAAVLVDPDASHAPPLPHISASDMQELRREFVDQLPDHLRPQNVGPLLDRWARELLPSATIPPRHRAVWNGTLKRAVVDRLRAWFREHQLETPVDLIEEVESAHAPKRDTTEELRSLVVRCIQVMTRSELEQLPLPAAVVLRSRPR